MKTTFALAALAVSAVSGQALQPRWPLQLRWPGEVKTTSTVTDYTTTYVTDCPVTTTK